jgi:TonB family protein
MTNDRKKKHPKRPPASVVVGVMVAVLASGIWWLSQNIAGVTRGEAPVPTVNLLPPPPPAPPPPPPPPPPPDPPKDIEPPKPDAPKADDSKQLTIAGPAQAGGDSFGIKAGSGGGMAMVGGPTEGPAQPSGNGFAEAAYSRYLATEIQRAVQADDRVNRQVFAVDLAVWIDGAGRLTRARIVRGSGDSRLDDQLVAALEGMRSVDDPPPPSLRFPQRVAIRGRRG